jgi:hypothetical protein
MADDTIDVERLLGEIDDEVRRRRADGELDPQFERELDALFAPSGGPSGAADSVRLLEAAERAAQIDATPPAHSQIAGGEFVKRALGRSMSWYVGNVARQVSGLGANLVGAVRLLGERVARVEAAVELDARAAGAAPLPPHLDPAPWARAVATALTGVEGRVLHGEGGDGALVRTLSDAGFDVYGVEPRLALAERATMHDVDMREEPVLDHLGLLPPAALGALVLSGCVDTMESSRREQLIGAARRAVAPEGRLVLLGTDPARWGDGDTAVVADLAPGHPWRAATWSHVLHDRGFDVQVAGDQVDGGLQMTIAVRRPA